MIVGEQVAALLGLWWPIDCQKYQVRLKVGKHGDDGDIDGEDLYIIGAVCVSVSKSHYLLGKLFWQVNFFS